MADCTWTPVGQRGEGCRCLGTPQHLRALFPWERSEQVPRTWGRGGWHCRAWQGPLAGEPVRGRILLLMASEGPPGLRGMDGKTQEGLTDPGWSVTPAVGSSFPIAGEKMGLWTKLLGVGMLWGGEWWLADGLTGLDPCLASPHLRGDILLGSAHQAPCWLWFTCHLLGLFPGESDEMCSLWQPKLKLCSCIRGVFPHFASLLRVGCPWQDAAAGRDRWGRAAFRGTLSCSPLSELGNEPKSLSS